MLLACATLAGKREQAKKLLGNLQVDTRKTRELLDWTPVVSMEQELESTSRHYLESLQ
jgi:nucleoside-diphosphate-sugar epimerase